MNRVFVQDVRMVTALGDLEATFSGLLAGRTAIRPIKRGFTGMAATMAELDPPLAPSRLACMVDHVLDQMPGLPANASQNTLLITATTKAGVDSLESCLKEARADIEPAFPDWLTAHVQKRLGLRQPGLTISAACASSTIALIQGARAIAFGRAESVLIVCADIVSEFVFRGFAALKALDDQPCRPFDRNRAGLTLGEGAAVIHLVGEHRAKSPPGGVRGEIIGWGQANDAVHVTAPARDGCGLIAAMNAALNRAGLTPEEVGAVHAHGTGTVYNDAMELTALQAVFGDDKPPIHSVKGAVGHTLGAAGGVETAISLMSLQTGTVPPTVGLDEPENAAMGSVSQKARSLPRKVILTTNSGFGGINAALILKSAESESCRRI